jgi:hypothetical protein
VLLKWPPEQQFLCLLAAAVLEPEPQLVALVALQLFLADQFPYRQQAVTETLIHLQPVEATLITVVQWHLVEPLVVLVLVLLVMPEVTLVAQQLKMAISVNILAVVVLTLTQHRELMERHGSKAHLLATVVELVEQTLTPMPEMAALEEPLFV